MRHAFAKVGPERFMYVGDCQSVKKLGPRETRPLASGFERANWVCCCCCCCVERRRECRERMRTWPAECRVFSYGAVLPNEATNMGLMDIIFVAPAWLDGDCWRELERDGGQVISLISVFSMNSFFSFFFFSLFSLFLPEPLLFARVVVCVCVCVWDFNHGLYQTGGRSLGAV